MNTEVEKLLSLICQGGEIKVAGGQLLVSPPAIAQKYGEQIRKLKPKILLALGHCPKCATELITKIEPLPLLSETMRNHSYCPNAGHYDKWKV